MIDSHPIRYYFNLKLDDKNELTLFHKIILFNLTPMFNSTLEFFSNKFKEELGINNSKSNSQVNSRESNPNVCFYQLEDKKTIDTEESNELSLIKLLSLKDKDGNTPMLFAAYKGNIEIIMKLIEIGVKYDTKNNAGLDVIHMAAQNDNPNVIVFFKEKYNYDIFQSDIQGNNPVHWACSNCAKMALGYLLYYIDDKNKSVLNAVNNNGQTALHLTILTNESNTIIKKLIKKGINTNIKDNSGLTVYDIAKNNHKNEINNILIEYSTTNCFGINYHINDLKNKYFKFVLFILIFTLLFYGTTALLIPYIEENLGNQFKLKCLFNIVSFVFVCDFIYIVSSNPGVLTNKKKESLLELVIQDQNIQKICPYCMVDQTNYTKHCFLCNECVAIYDHHCHWINNCIGVKNKKKFIYFLCLLFGLIILDYFISLQTLVLPMNEQYMKKNYIMSHFYYKIIISGLMGLINLFFFFPVAYIIYNQIKNRCPPKPIKNEVKEYYAELKEINDGNNMVNHLQIKED